MTEPDTLPSFADLGLNAELLKTLNAVGYETPSPIQAKTIPHLLAGRDVLGQAQTGTGKTAAFALPLLSRIDLNKTVPQVLVLAPTRELALQVSEAFQRYAAKLKKFHVLPIYGGQAYPTQLKQLQRGPHVVVGTPGRVMDHMRRGSLRLDNLTALVLDEADEMLRMGFIDDVEWILEQTPTGHQTALFSATMPKAIATIAQKFLNDPVTVSIEVRTVTAETVRQRYWQVTGMHKLDALTRILEAEPFDGMIVFVRTKTATAELAEKLEARGFSAGAINGDMSQNLRERVVSQLKNGKLDILVATDVAARGLDVERITHVINYDIPYDIEAYIHRIGRTGRAGRTGDAILFVAPREKRFLSNIEKATRQKVELMVMPTSETINNQRLARFKQRITDTLEAGDLSFHQALIESYQQEHDVPAVTIAAALSKLVQGDTPLLLPKEEKARKKEAPEKAAKERRSSEETDKKGARKKTKVHKETVDFETYQLEVGHSHGVKPANIVGAIANEAGLDAQYINAIKIDENTSTVQLPAGMPKTILKHLRKTWVCGRQLDIKLIR